MSKWNLPCGSSATALYMALTLSLSSLTSTWAITPSLRFGAAAARSCGLGAGDDDVAEVGDGLGHAGHEPGHLAGVGGPPGDPAHDGQAAGRALVGQEPPGRHHLERPGLGVQPRQPGAGVDPRPVLDGVEVHAGADLAEEDLPGLGG